jgi:hypothetical protein
MFFNYLQKNVNTQKSIIPSCTKSFFTKGLLDGDNFLILLFSPNFTFFVFKKMREGTTLRARTKFFYRGLPRRMARMFFGSTSLCHLIHSS